MEGQLGARRQTKYCEREATSRIETLTLRHVVLAQIRDDDGTTKEQDSLSHCDLTRICLGPNMKIRVVYYNRRVFQFSEALEFIAIVLDRKSVV